MSFYDAIRVGAAGAGDYEIERSLRFNSADGPYLENTPSSHSNKKTMTFSFWFKRVVNDNFVSIFRSFGNSDNRHSLDFLSGGQIRLWGNYNGSVAMTVQTSQVFRDPCAWYHFVLALDTTQATASNRVKMYVNGEQITSFSNSSYPSQNFEFGFNDQNVATQIGVPSDTQCNYYIAEFQEIDGSQLTPSSFGETNAVTGQWNPIKYAGSFGTNGFYLNFSDNSGTTATTLGKDSSGNGRNFTPNNFSVSAGEGNDSLEDTPTLNYPTLNHRDIGFTTQSQMVFSNGNLNVRAESGKWASTRGTFHVKTGKWYWEVKCVLAGGLRPFIGIIESTVRLASNQTEQSNELGPSSTGIAYQTGFPLIRGGTNTTGYSTNVPSCATGDIVGVALDMDNKKVFFSKNGTFFASQDPANSSGELVGFSTTMQNATIAPAIQVYNNTSEAAINFGQRAFDYTPPTGYKKLNSANLPDPSILLPDKHFDTLLWTGNETSRSITGLNFQPDWVWIKNRTRFSHALFDTVRGATKRLRSDDNSVEATEANTVTAFNSDGYTITTSQAVNENSVGHVGWNWNAGDTDSATYTVKVVSDSGNKYRFNDYGTSAVTLDLAEGGTYTFDQSDSSMSSHPMQLSTTANGTHGGGSAYSTGVTYELDGSTVTASAFISGFSSASSRKLIITVAASAPTLYYYCYYHSGMGGAVNTNSTLGSSNFDGSIQSTVKANTTAGFSIATWVSDGSGSPTSFGHGLGAKPEFLIIKNRTGSGGNWQCWLTTFSNQTNNFISFNREDTGTETAGAAMWGTINSSIVSFRHSANSVNGNTMIGYFFNSVEGYCKFGEYTGNGSTNGPFVFTGFRIAFLLIRRTNGTGNWYLFDSKRNTFNYVNGRLKGETSGGEDTSYNVFSFLSNGFKLENQYDGSWNGNGDKYMFLAFAESPFKNSRAR
jgi:hypothetical protein